MEMLSTVHWQYHQDENGIVVLVLDRPEASVNTIDAAVLSELFMLLQKIREDNQVKGLVIQSGKTSGFIAGADIHYLSTLQNQEASLAFIKQGQAVFQYLADFAIPTVALIHGHCLGGGLELALACRYRVLIDDPKTRLGLPEVQLGIHPGWGGTVRLPRLIGALKSMDLMLSGRSVSAKAAQAMGLVDSVVPERQAQVAVEYYITRQPTPIAPSRLASWSNLDRIRPWIAKWLYRKLGTLHRVHYSAPYALVDHWVQSGISDLAFEKEAQSVSELSQTETAQNLVRVFFLREQLKSEAKARGNIPNQIHVIGAGTMGGDIAAWCALKGLKVTLEDQNVQALACALQRALILFEKHLKTPVQIQAAQDRLVVDLQGAGIAKADLIIEAVVEQTEVKRAVFKRVIEHAKPNAIIATNTSTIPLNVLVEDNKLSGRFIGLHFFNPVAKMPLIEIVQSEESHPEVVQRAAAWVNSIDKLPLLVKSAPGFLVNRVLMPYLLESIILVESGVPIVAIDKAAVDFGMPMGPLALMDTIGLDVCLQAAQNLTPVLGAEIPLRLVEMVKNNQLGCKTQQGFYQYKKGKIVQGNVDAHYRAPEDLFDRLLLPMCNQAVACLREHIVSSAALLDAGLLFGAGFPPFRGGLLHYIAQQGRALMLERLNLLVQRYGQRFVPDPGWGTIDFES